MSDIIYQNQKSHDGRPSRLFMVGRKKEENGEACRCLPTMHSCNPLLHACCTNNAAYRAYVCGTYSAAGDTTTVKGACLVSEAEEKEEEASVLVSGKWPMGGGGGGMGRLARKGGLKEI